MGRQGDKIAVIDCETDPFDGETFVLPFVWGFFDGIKYIQFDGPECTYNLVEYIKILRVSSMPITAGNLTFISC